MATQGRRTEALHAYACRLVRAASKKWQLHEGKEIRTGSLSGTLALVPPNFFGIEPGPDLPASVGSEGLGGLSTFRVWPALNVRACIAATLRNSLPVGLLGGAAPTPRSAAPATLVLPRRPTHRLAASGPGAAIASKLRRAPTLPNCGATGHRLGALFWGLMGLVRLTRRRRGTRTARRSSARTRWRAPSRQACRSSSSELLHLPRRTAETRTLVPGAHNRIADDLDLLEIVRRHGPARRQI